MAKGSAKKPKESKCRGSGAPLEGREWVRIGGNKWLREVAEKQGKHIPKEYADKDGSEFDKERAARNEAKEMAPVAALLAEVAAEGENLEEIPDADAPLEDAPIEEEQDATYPGEE